MIRYLRTSDRLSEVSQLQQEVSGNRLEIK